MLSPLDLQSKKVAARKKKYYNKIEMDDYIDLVMENYKEAYHEIQELQKQVKTLSEGIQYYRSIESTMQKALLLAEKTSKETKDAAILKAEAIEKDANAKASKIVSEAEQEYDAIKEKCLSLVQQFSQYRMQLKQVATAQLELVTSETFEVYSPELDILASSQNILPPVQEEDVPPEVTVSQEETAEEADLDFSYEPENDLMFDEGTATETESPNLDSLIPGADTRMSQLLDESSSVEEDLGKTVVLPKLGGTSSKKERTEEDTASILTADTIDLSQPLRKVREMEGIQPINDSRVVQPVRKETKKAPQDTLVMEPLDAQPVVPLESELPESKSRQPEKLEAAPIDTGEDLATLDSLLQSMNMGGKKSKKRKKKGQEEDPFEFLGSVDDF